MSNPLRVKLLQALVLHDERTTADLATACGLSRTLDAAVWELI